MVIRWARNKVFVWIWLLLIMVNFHQKREARASWLSKVDTLLLFRFARYRKHRSLPLPIAFERSKRRDQGDQSWTRFNPWREKKIYWTILSRTLNKKDITSEQVTQRTVQHIRHYGMIAIFFFTQDNTFGHFYGLNLTPSSTCRPRPGPEPNWNRSEHPSCN